MPSSSNPDLTRDTCTAVIRYKLAHMSRETEALQSWIEVRNITSLEVLRLTYTDYN
jgi:hypothetical protein